MTAVVNRRHFLTACAASSAALLDRASGAAEERAGRMGLVVYSYSIRRGAEPRGSLQDPLGFLEHCRDVGAGGGQMSLGVRDRAYNTRVQRLLDGTALYLEAITRLPRERSDLERFETEVRCARECGARVLRAALLDGRRYEIFRTAEAFRESARQTRQTLALAKPVLERQQMVLGVENHKDFRTEELVELIRAARSPQIGVCLDTGNSMALLEPPLETLEALAPLAVTTHIKDMAVEEHRDGFLLAEVPLGTGLLDLPRTVQTLRRARPDIRLNLEMITRDPLRIPCLTRDYWATLEEVSGRRLVDMLTLVRGRAAAGGLPRVSSLAAEAKVAREEENVRASLRFARQRLER